MNSYRKLDFKSHKEGPVFLITHMQQTMSIYLQALKSIKIVARFSAGLKQRVSVDVVFGPEMF